MRQGRLEWWFHVGAWAGVSATDVDTGSSATVARIVAMWVEGRSSIVDGRRVLLLFVVKVGEVNGDAHCRTRRS